MTALDEYRDDGIVAGPLGRALGPALPALPAQPVVFTLLAGVPLLVLAVTGRLEGWAPLLAAGCAVLLAGAVAGRSLVGRLDWLVPPLLRTLEYCSIAAVTASVAPQAMPLCYALLAALAFHHYDTVYRLRHRRVPPPDWLRLVGGGWDVRLLVVAVLAAVGLLDYGLAIGAAVLGVLFVGESVAGWLRPEEVS